MQYPNSILTFLFPLDDGPVRGTRNKSDDFQQIFEFQGSFGGDQLGKHLSTESSRTVANPKIHHKLSLPKISLDSVIDMQKSESFVNRCQKLNNIEKQSQARELSLSGGRNLSNESKRSKGKSSSPYRPQINKDLTSILGSPKSILKSPQTQRSSNQRGSSKKITEAERQKLPKLNLTHLVNGMNSTQRSKSTPQERAIDSNRAIAFAYYTRRLMLIGWRSFFNYRLEQANKRFFDRICNQKRWKALKKSAFYGFKAYKKLHSGHKAMKTKAHSQYCYRLGQSVLHEWINEYKESVMDRQKLEMAMVALQKYKRNVILRVWRNATLKCQLKAVQDKTAQHIFRQRYLQMAFQGLKLVSNYNLNERRLHVLANGHNHERLFRKSFTAFQVYKFQLIKAQEMQRIGQKVYDFNLAKFSFKQMRHYHVNSSQYRRIKQCAQNYYNANLAKMGVELFKKHTVIKQKKNQKHNLSNKIYTNKLKSKFIRFIKASNREFSKQSVKIFDYQANKLMKQVLFSLQNNAKRKRVARIVQSKAFYYIAYLQFFNNAQAFDFNQKKMALTKRPYYLKLRSHSQTLLKKYVLQNILKAWTQETQKIQAFKNNLNAKRQQKVIRALRSQNFHRAKYRYMLNQYKQRKHQSIIKISFQKLRSYSFKRRYERIITQKFSELKKSAILRKTLMKWALNYKRKAIRSSQKLVANEISEKNRMDKAYRKWKSIYSIINRKRSLRESSQSFFRHKYLRQFFTKMLSVYYQLHGLELILQKYLQRKRMRSLKKSICGFLQNVLVQNNKHHQFNKAQAFRQHYLNAKVITSWKLRLPELKQKNTLFRMIVADKNLRRKAKAIESLKTYLRYRVQKNETSHFMGVAVTQISKKRFFNQWLHHLQRRTGIKMLEHTTSKYRMREFFRRVLRKEEFEEATVRHMALFNAFKLLQFAFVKGFQKNVQQKYQWFDSAVQMRQLSIKLNKRMILREWRECFEQKQREIVQAQFCLIQIKNAIMKKYFGGLKTFTRSERVKKQAIRSYIIKIKRGCFYQLKYNGKHRTNCKKVFQYLSSQKRKQTILQYLRTWMQELWELQFIKPVVMKRDKKLKQQAIRSMKIFLETVQNQKQLISNIQQSHIQLIHMQAFRLCKQFTLLSKQQNERICVMQQVCKQNLKQKIISALKNYYRENVDIIRKRIDVKYARIFKIKKTIIHLWEKQSEQRITRVNVMKALCSMATKVELRFALSTILQYALDEKSVFMRGEEQNEYRLLQQKRIALLKLRDFKNREIVSHERRKSVKLYWHKKQQLRIIQILKLGTRLIIRRRANKSKALHFRIWRLLKKSVFAIARQTQQSKTLRYLTLQLQQQRRLLNGPRVINQLKYSQLSNKEDRIRNQFANDFQLEKIYTKTFKALYWNMVKEKDRKYKEKKALTFRNQKLTSVCISTISMRAQYCQIIKSKRQALIMTIQGVDRNGLMMSAFQAMALYTIQEQEKLGYIKLQLMLNCMQRAFDSLKFFKCFKKSLKERQMIIALKKNESLTRNALLSWMRNLNIEMKTKMMQRTRIDHLKLRTLAGFQRNWHVKQIVKICLQRKVVQYLSCSLKALQNYYLRNKKLKIIQQQLILKDLIQTVEKSFMALRYHCILQKNKRLMKEKSKEQLILRSFSGWKYQILEDKTKKYFQTLRQKRDITFFFQYWLNQYRFNSSKRTALANLIERKDTEFKMMSLVIWKRKAFGRVWIEKLQDHLLVPNQTETLVKCLASWRKYTSYKLNRESYFNHIQAFSNQYLAKRYLKQWIEASTKDNGMKLKVHIMARKLGAIAQRKLLHKALYRIQVFGEREEFINEKLEELNHNRLRSQILDYFGMWRKRFQDKELIRAAREQNEIKLMNECFLSLKAHCKYQQLKKDIVHKTANSLMQFASMGTRLAMVAAFEGHGITLNELSKRALWFYRLREACSLQKVEKVKIIKAEKFHKYKLYLKYFFSIINYATDSFQNNELKRKAKAYLRYRRSVLTLKGFVLNTLKQRKLKNALAFYHSKICQQAFNALAINYQNRQMTAAMKTQMMHLLKKKCVKIFREAFTQWRMKFRKRVFNRDAVDEFQNYKNLKLKKLAFGYLFAVCEQQKKVRDMTKRAQGYFQKSRRLKMLYKVFHTINEYSKQRQYTRDQIVDADLQAMRFNAFMVQQRHFRAWKKEVQHNKKRHLRSKLYAIFSAWKFYVKERSLLKKYLRECNGMTGNPSLMSTGELRENYARVNHNVFADSFSSGTSPYRQDERVLSPINVNAMVHSPHFSKMPDSNNSAGRPKEAEGLSGIFMKYGGDRNYQNNDIDLQATGNFSSIGSKSGINVSQITQSSKNNNRYSRL